MVAIYIAEPLAKIFNKSMGTGTYPALWKTANVKPILKEKGHRQILKITDQLACCPVYQKYLRK